MRPFNSLKSFDRLMNVGVSEKQAREFVGIFEESLDASVENLTTKSELQAVEIALRTDIKTVETTLRSEIQASEAAIRADMQAGDTALKLEIQALRSDMQALEISLKAEIKSEAASVKAELKHEIHEQGKRLSALESGQILMQRLFFGGTLTILLSIGALFLHQG